MAQKKTCTYLVLISIFLFFVSTKGYDLFILNEVDTFWTDGILNNEEYNWENGNGENGEDGENNEEWTIGDERVLAMELILEEEYPLNTGENEEGNEENEESNEQDEDGNEEGEGENEPDDICNSGLPEDENICNWQSDDEGSDLCKEEPNSQPDNFAENMACLHDPNCLQALSFCDNNNCCYFKLKDKNDNWSVSGYCKPGSRL